MAALLLEAKPGLFPAEIYDALEKKAIPVEGQDTDSNDNAIFDYDHGYGFVDAVEAVAYVAGNLAPTVSAGSDQTITLPSQALLDGMVSDDGLPNPPAAITAAWTMVNGPGVVSFGNAAAVDTTASFSVEGTYVLQLTANDGEMLSRDQVTITVNSQPPSEPVSIAFDGFESRDFAGGSGWVSGWSSSGDVQLRINRDKPYEGSAHVRLRRGTGHLDRAVNLSGATSVALKFCAKVNSFEASDQALVRVSPNGSSYTVVMTFSATDSDNIYHCHQIPLSGFAMTDNFHIAFDAEMSGRNDLWFLDNVEIVGIE